ncbi:hypothetical protein DM860_006213 [Cuscuta australis]|uniref:Uncharacterized protein n=1 Tax=Cuscuta australis TaxID=267555 RepID=A0A328DP15_9ASTE|nr:hypothetical protein DM860_006213 [Cuscuta australis]
MWQRNSAAELAGWDWWALRFSRTGKSHALHGCLSSHIRNQQASNSISLPCSTSFQSLSYDSPTIFCLEFSVVKLEKFRVEGGVTPRNGVTTATLRA